MFNYISIITQYLFPLSKTLVVGLDSSQITIGLFYNINFNIEDNIKDWKRINNIGRYFPGKVDDKI